LLNQPDEKIKLKLQPYHYFLICYTALMYMKGTLYQWKEKVVMTACPLLACTWKPYLG